MDGETTLIRVEKKLTTEDTAPLPTGCFAIAALGGAKTAKPRVHEENLK